ncbi:class I SAM-dependent methyltransferase [Oscillatoria salina]|uniref:class I SAM-dependent methyltransferase n=1 Tax=Oscillatoria salina TaxID=331517 RepID=UPI0013B9893B|nr:class I SAM-dependent methyltransferase [Oscillatoria salina]MBZ8179038.1 class I SAM-dependent methyltransferase [Oscillatoria salina IIICB1]NET88491.1 class I SAM-dependent methyltransferase [Kamptonema sp. SIO1D9]
MTATTINNPGLASRFVNGILAIKPLASFAKYKAREMMIKRAEKIGVPWREEVRKLRQHDWDREFAEVENPQLVYPEYYLRSFHAYDRGNLSWDAALEVEVAAYAVHAGIWQDAGAKGDPRLRQSYHNLLKEQIPSQPQAILDLGCSVGMSSFALQATYPNSKVTGIDLSPYFLAVANYKNRQRQQNISWLHAAAENTGLPDRSFDLVSAFLLFHELPQSAATEILAEARRLLRPGGYLGIMEMNPRSQVYAQMPPYILTLLKSTEPYLDQYFSLDLADAIADAGFEPPTIISNSPRHRTVIAKVK